ncbi:MAG: bifunctional ornithine acetyltransferase/N-acetylglutamate synthase [Spirochaetales bacterium]
MQNFSSESQYWEYLHRIGQVPQGFRIATEEIHFYPVERPVPKPLPMRLVLIEAVHPVESFAGVFTRNSFPGAPVLIGKKRMAQERVRGILINNKVSNVGASSGVADAEEILGVLGSLRKGKAEEFIPASTGIIGWKLPKQEIIQALPSLIGNLGKANCADAARAIMTTDAYPKLAVRPLGAGSLVGFAKGAGMIEPNLATMLAFLLTDVHIPREVLQTLLQEVAEETFNCISVDGDQSTSDTLLALSSSIHKEVAEAEVRKAFREVCGELAQHIVRNGEGTAHVIQVTVCSAPTFLLARNIGKAVINSPLVKTAIFGNDPNVGRIVGAVGDFLGNHSIFLDSRNWEIILGEEKIFSQGRFVLDPEKEVRLAAYLKQASMDPTKKTYPPHERVVELTLELGAGTSQATVLGADLSFEYVRENADYRS